MIKVGRKFIGLSQNTRSNNGRLRPTNLAKSNKPPVGLQKASLFQYWYPPTVPVFLLPFAKLVQDFQVLFQDWSHIHPRNIGPSTGGATPALMSATPRQTFQLMIEGQRWLADFQTKFCGHDRICRKTWKPPVWTLGKFRPNATPLISPLFNPSTLLLLLSPCTNTTSAKHTKSRWGPC